MGNDVSCAGVDSTNAVHPFSHSCGESSLQAFQNRPNFKTHSPVNTEHEPELLNVSMSSAAMASVPWRQEGPLAHYSSRRALSHVAWS